MQFIQYQVKERVGYMTLNRAEKRNALNPTLVKELTQSLLEAEKDNKVKVIVIKAVGSTFCAGADLEYLKELQSNSYEENLEDSNNLMNLFKTIYTLKKVVIAQVNGHAIAGGCGLVSVCDFSFSVDTANFGYSEVKIGFIPAIVMVFLLRKIGEAKAKFLLLSGQIITADEALQYGIINKVVKEESLDKQVFEFAQGLCNHNSSQSMEETKRMINEIQSMESLESILNYASQKNATARSTEDCKKGIRSFLNKESLKW